MAQVRLPVQGADSGTWGQILNDFLSVSHAGDGTLKDGTIVGAKLANDTVAAGKLSTGVQTSLTKADASVQSVNAKFPSSGNVTLTAGDVGAASQTDLNSLSASTAAKTQLTAVVVYSGSAYPARPSGFANVKYIGPVAPTTAIDGDEWVSTA